MLCRYPCAGKLIAAGATRPQEQAMAKTKPFVSDIENIRKRARQDIDKGAMTAGYKADRATVVTLLNHALATEIVCVLRYKYHYYMASGIHSQAIKAEFLQHANEEQGHADQIAERIAIDSYREMIAYVGGDDPTTRRVLESILAMEEEHAEDMNTLLEQLGKKGEPAKPSPAGKAARKRG
jgi:bacterioferritin